MEMNGLPSFANHACKRLTNVKFVYLLFKCVVSATTQVVCPLRTIREVKPDKTLVVYYGSNQFECAHDSHCQRGKL